MGEMPMAESLKQKVDKFNEWVNKKKSRKSRHSHVEKSLGRYLIMNEGPFKRELKDLKAEFDLGGSWPADVVARYSGDFPAGEIVEVEMHHSPEKQITVGYNGFGDAREKLDYLESACSISPGDARHIRRCIDYNENYIGALNSSFRFTPLKKGTAHDLVELGWDAKCESQLERKLRFAESYKNVVSFCVPVEAYKDVLKEIRENPDMRVGAIYPFKEVEERKFEILGTIPVFQGIDVKKKTVNQ